MTIGSRIRNRRKTLQLSQADLAKAAGVSQQMIGKLETGVASETGKLVPLAEALGVTAEWLATGGDNPTVGGAYVRNPDGSLSRAEQKPAAFSDSEIHERSDATPVKPWSSEDDLDPDAHLTLSRLDLGLSAGHGNFVAEAAEKYDNGQAFRADFMRKRGWSPKTHFSMRAEGSSMEPTVRDGAPVVIDISDRDIKSGRIYAIEIDGNGTGSEILLKRLDRLPDGRIRVRSDNQQPMYAPYEVDGSDLKIIGRAVWTSTLLD